MTTTHEPLYHLLGAEPIAPPTLSAFGARLALIRWRMGWNQKEAALACGMSQATWREWELFGRLPRDLVAVAERIAFATGIDAYWVMTGQVHPAVVPPEGGTVTQATTNITKECSGSDQGVTDPANNAECDPIDILPRTIRATAIAVVPTLGTYQSPGVAS